MDEIASNAGVSKGTIYLYYPSKEDLLIASIEHRIRLNQSFILPIIKLQASDENNKMTPEKVKKLIADILNRVLDLIMMDESRKAIRVVKTERHKIKRLRDKQLELVNIAVTALSAFLTKAHKDGAVKCPKPKKSAILFLGAILSVPLMSEFILQSEEAKPVKIDRELFMNYALRGLGL